MGKILNSKDFSEIERDREMYNVHSPTNTSNAKAECESVGFSYVM